MNGRWDIRDILYKHTPNPSQEGNYESFTLTVSKTPILTTAILIMETWVIKLTIIHIEKIVRIFFVTVVNVTLSYINNRSNKLFLIQ